MAKERVSHHASMRKLRKHLTHDQTTNTWDRYGAQGLSTPTLVKLLTQDYAQLTSDLLTVKQDAVKAADAILAHNETNRA